MPGLASQRICFCISILCLIGLLKNWMESIDDLLKYAELSFEECYISIIILSNLFTEFSTLNTTQKILYQIKDCLYNKRDIIKNFIIKIMNNNLEKEGELGKMINEKIIELAKTWIHFGLNLLEISSLCEKFLSSININNINKISELLIDAINNSKGAKIYSDIDINEEIYNDSDLKEKNNLFEVIEKSCNMNEMETLFKIINMIDSFMKNYNINNDKDDILLTGIANIFSCICENYIYLFFLKNDLSHKLLQNFNVFISLSKRKISYKFFEALSEMREFINSKYHFYNLTEDEKKEFMKYLLLINENVMINCKLKNLDIKYDLFINQEFLYINTNKDNNNYFSYENENDIENDLNEINVTQYRKSAEDVFYHIFIIIITNFKEGERIYLEKLTNILTMANVNDPSILNDKDRLLAVEIVLYVMTSIIESFESLEISTKIVSDFTLFILNSQLINNDNMILKFLLYLDKSSSYIPLDKNVYILSIKFLIDISKNKILETISTIIIYNITMFAKNFDSDVFNLIFNVYSNNYDNYTDIQCVSNLSNALLCSLGINEKINDSNIENVKQYFINIMSPSTERIKKLNLNNIDDKTLKLEIKKDYNVQQNVLQKSENINKVLYCDLFQIHIIETFSVTKDIFTKFSQKDFDLITLLTDIYVLNIQKLERNSIYYFNELNELMIFSLNSSPNNYHCITIFKFLYPNYLENNPNNNELIINYFFYISKQMSSYIINEKKFQIEMLKNFGDFFYYIFPKLNLSNLTNEHINLLFYIINLYIEGIKSFNENSLLRSLIKALSSLIASDTLNKEIIINKYNQIMLGIFYGIDNYDSFTVKDFIIFCSNAFGFDKNMFLNTLFEILNSPSYSMFIRPKQDYISLIKEYLLKYGEIDNKLSNIMQVIIEIKQGKTRLESLHYFALEISRSKILKKK